MARHSKKNPNPVGIKLALIMVALLFVAAAGATGCNNGNENNNAVGQNKGVEGKTDVPPNENSTEKGSSSFMDQASSLVDNVKQSGSDGIGWLQEKAGGAAKSGGEMAVDATAWANGIFHTLKDQGLTTAKSTSDWVTQDFTNMGAWQYKVLTMTPDEMGQAEDKLNELGALRWECFHVAQSGTSTLFYLKKRRTSYIRNLPMRDMLRLVPLMGGGGE